jgi:hypothetical protein
MNATDILRVEARDSCTSSSDVIWYLKQLR